jgi:broad specificity phosphatase PhoE
MYESSANVHRRTEKLKDLLREYSKTYKNIAVVCHNNIIRFALAT